MASTRMTGWATIAVLSAGMFAPIAVWAAGEARGVVFEDLNGNGSRDAAEPGIAGVVLSNETDFVVTDAEGKYAIALEEGRILFVVKPSGYAPPVNKDQIPQYHYIHKPEGSPKSYYAGVAPTGPLPGSIDFPLVKQDEDRPFRVILMADPQPQTGQEVDYVVRDVIMDLPAAKADFGITLGDIMFDVLDLFDGYNRAVGKVGIPFYNVIGNHDMNYDAANDPDSDETYTRLYGPPNFSFNFGRVHFVAFDTILWESKGGHSGSYTETFEQHQIDWLKKDLEHVPEDYLVVICTHAPLWSATSKNPLTGNIDLLFDALKDRREVLALSGHTHYNAHHAFTKEEGWQGAGTFHSHNIVTVCGSWWSGPKDYRGIPVADQRDGSPNGYVLMDFDGTRYVPNYRAAGLSPEYQMRIYAPGTHDNGADPGKTLLVNVFDGMPEATVEYSVDDGPMRPLAFKPQLDPVSKALYSGPLEAGKTWVNPTESHHMWEGVMTEEELERGMHLVKVRYTDRFGREFESTSIYTR